MSSHRVQATAALALLALAACGTNEVLVAKSAVVPAGIDLSGQWRLREETGLEQVERAEREAAGGIPISPQNAARQGTSPQAQSKPNRKSLVHIFLETGSTLRITQTAQGLFISFDRAIVEEYLFGENRTVNVGPVEATRVSGWEKAGYVIETLDDDGNKLVERYRMEEGGALLVRRIEILRRGKPALSVVQHFDRV